MEIRALERKRQGRPPSKLRRYHDQARKLKAGLGLTVTLEELGGLSLNSLRQTVARYNRERGGSVGVISCEDKQHYQLFNRGETKQ